ncbi:hypothetical protein HY409_01890 [Candidatus Gottesmanbacteria bacterium]|nr:hypothetical protein [Candidatus Gottesmanbacteria bacterium]
MGSDVWLVVHWWGSLFLVGAVAFPLTKRLFSNWPASTRDGDPTRGWFDQGYLFSKAVGMAVVTWIVYVLGTINLLPFTNISIGLSLLTLFIVGVALNLKSQISKLKTTTQNSKREDVSPTGSGITTKNVVVIFFEEVFFFTALLLWSWVKGHEPSIHGLEKFMDFGFMKSILNSQYFPPADMWYAGLPVNYYYFGHMVVAVLTKLSGIDLVYTFNLMLATIFAFTLTMSFSIGYQLFKFQAPSIKPQTSTKHKIQNSKFGIWNLLAGLLTAFLVTLAGNMQTLYAFTKGYTGDNVKPFWELFWPLAQFWQKLPEGLNTYWYANATRFIPFTIHEFPSYSFVVSDVHGHVLSLPFVLLAIGMLIVMFDLLTQGPALKDYKGRAFFIFYGFLVGVLLMTNASDGPIYLALLIATLGIFKFQFSIFKWKTILKQIVLVIVIAGITSLPFLFHFKSFVSGLAVNCPPEFLANSKIGPLIFEGAEKCQRSPVWMMALLWGFFVYSGGWLIITKLKTQSSPPKADQPLAEKLKSETQNSKLSKIQELIKEVSQIDLLLIVFFLFSLFLIIFPEFFYFKDIYPAHFRSNTMFKLGYQAFILFSIVSGYTVVSMIVGSASTHRDKSQIPNLKSQTNSKFQILNSKQLFFLFLLPQLFLVSIYPIFSVRSYFDSLRTYKGLDGLAWLKSQYPDDWEAIQWLNKAISEKREARSKNQSKNTSFLSLISYRVSAPVLVEADGDSYTDFARFSAFTGIPSIIGWPVHEWLWRGTYDVVAPRREEVRKIYESEDISETRQILEKYTVRYILVGTLERQKYTNVQEWKFTKIGKEVFRSGITVIYADLNGGQNE